MTLAGPRIQGAGDPHAVVRRDASHALALREILPQQAVGVLVGAALPGAMRMRNVDRHLCVLGKEAVLPHFGPLVVGEGTTQLSRQRPQLAREGPTHRGRVLRQADQDAGLFCPSTFAVERGTNENTNGLLRQLFPKGTRFTQVSRAEIKRVQAMFNDRPRKILNWHSPAHAFIKLLR